MTTTEKPAIGTIVEYKTRAATFYATIMGYSEDFALTLIEFNVNGQTMRRWTSSEKLRKII